MKRRFVVPVAAAMALHTILLFGFRPAHPGVSGPRLIDPAVIPPPVDAVKIEWSAASDDQDTTPAKGEPEPVKLMIPDPPVRESLTEITMPASIPSPIHPTTQPIGPIGDPAGPSDGIGPGSAGTINSVWLDNPPRTRSQLAPVYPYAARITGRTGEVLVEFVVDETGHVLNPRVLRSNDPAFEEPTLRAVAKWRFEPGRRGGRVVRFRMAVPVEFSVNP